MKISLTHAPDKLRLTTSLQDNLQVIVTHMKAYVERSRFNINLLLLCIIILLIVVPTAQLLLHCQLSCKHPNPLEYGFIQTTVLFEQVLTEDKKDIMLNISPKIRRPQLLYVLLQPQDASYDGPPDPAKVICMILTLYFHCNF